ncbi:hypothetical protein EON81_13845 [bacterium]|nr:MAG: hypothetical protein EON81_13845 [bacterium]
MRYAVLISALLLGGCKVGNVDEQAVAQPAVRTVVKTVPAKSGETPTPTEEESAPAQPMVIDSKMVGNWTTVSDSAVSQVTVIFSSDGNFSMSARGNAARGTYTLGQGSATATYRYTGKTPVGGMADGTATFQMATDGTSLTVASDDPTVGTATLRRASP